MSSFARNLLLSHSLTHTPDLPSSHRRPLTHALFDAASAEILLFSKDPEEEFETLVRANGIPKNVTVMGVSRLKKEYKQYEAKRQLCGSYDLFLSDDRCVCG